MLIRLLRYSWMAVLLASSLASMGGYLYFKDMNKQFIQGEINHRSQLLLHDVREIIQQHLDATEGIAAYIHSELVTHQSVLELDEAKDLLRGTIAAHPGELVQAAIFPPDAARVVTYIAPDAQAPLIRRADFSTLLPNKDQLTVVQSGRNQPLLRVFHLKCVQGTCSHLIADINLQSIINHMLKRDRDNLVSELYIRVALAQEDNDDFPLYIAGPKAVSGVGWNGSFDLADSHFSMHTAASPQLIHHLSTQTSQWVLGLGLILSLLLTHLVYNRARYGERLRRKVIERTKVIEDEQQKLAAIIDNANDSILLLDENGVVLRANPAVCELFGYQPAEWEGLFVHDLVPENIREAHIEWFFDEMTGKRYDVLDKTRELQAQRKDGSLFPCEVTVNEFQAGEEKRLSIILRDLTARKAFEDRLTWLSYYDDLTGLPNHRLFNDRVGQSIVPDSEQKRQFAIIHMTLARFRMVNDTLGNSVGEQVLKEVARRIRDIVHEPNMAARMGSNIFAVLLPGAEASQAVEIAQKIRQSMGLPFHIQDQEISMEMVFGIAVFPGDGDDTESLIKHAASAMTYAERNQLSVHCFSSEMERMAKKRLKIEQDLIKAVGHNQFELYYQSKHNLDHGAVFGVEALIRWNHPEQGFISPAEFIPVAEETGLIFPITHWVIDEACRQAIVWEKAGIRPGRIGINLSAVQLMEKNLAEEIIERILDSGAKPEWIEIEITETAAMLEPVTAIAIMRKLVESGISIAIDDFGTGYSSLAYLKRLPAEWLKIDMAFIRGLPDDEEDVTIVRSIIAMGHAMGMKIIAEGVETEAQLEFLRGEGCDAVQGYLFSKPLPAGEATSYIKKNVSN